jgi:hypothetical protein
MGSLASCRGEPEIGLDQVAKHLDCQLRRSSEFRIGAAPGIQDWIGGHERNRPSARPSRRCSDTQELPDVVNSGLSLRLRLEKPLDG